MVREVLITPLSTTNVDPPLQSSIQSFSIAFTEILEVNSFAFVYRLFHGAFPSLDGTILLNLLSALYILM